MKIVLIPGTSERASRILDNILRITELKNMISLSAIQHKDILWFPYIKPQIPLSLPFHSLNQWFPNSMGLIVIVNLERHRITITVFQLNHIFL